MELQLNRVKLLSLVKAVSQACASRSALPITSHVLLQADKNGLDVTATNLESYLTGRCKAKTKQEGGICVPPKPLINFLDKVGSETVELKSHEGALVVHANQVKFTLQGMAAADFPPMIKVEADNDATVYHLSEALKMVSHAITDDDSRPVLAGICLDLDQKKLIAVDGFRLAVVKVNMRSATKLSGRCIIPRDTVRLLLKLGVESAHVAIRKGETMEYMSVTGFNEPSLTLVSTLTQGIFPDYTQIIPKCTHRVTVNVGEVLNALVILPKEATIVRLVKDGKYFTVSARDSDDNQTEVKLSAKGAIKIALNPKHLCEVLKVIGKDENVTIQTTSPSIPLKIEHGKFLSAIMPMSCQWEEPKKKEEPKDGDQSGQEPVPGQGQSDVAVAQPESAARS